MEEKNRNQERNSGDSFSLFSKFFAPMRVLIKLHLRVAEKELKKDSARFIFGVVQIVLALFFIIMFFLMFTVLLIVAIYEFTVLNLFYSVLIVTGFNFFMSFIFFIGASKSFKKKFLPETRKLMKETIKELK